MKYVSVTFKGMEDLASSELDLLLKVKVEKIVDARLLFDTNKISDFSPRLARRVYSYISHFAFLSLDNLVSKVSLIDFSFKGSFVVRCSREGSHDFDSRDVERMVGEVIFKRGFKVDLKNPDNVIVVDITDNNCLLGVSLLENLSKRAYRIRISSSSINACLAAAAIKFSDASPGCVILDPFCRDGVIPIESSLLGFKDVFACDESLNNVKSAEINAKLANAQISFCKSDVDSLDLKFDERSVDRIITCPPFLSKKKKQSRIETLYKEFFYQANALLKDSGTLTFISPSPELLETSARRAGFALVKEKKVFVSNIDYKILVFKRV